MFIALSHMNIRQIEDKQWYVDSSAAAHVIGEAGKFIFLFPYHDKGTIVIENGAHHSISHIENFSIPMLDSDTLPLLDVLHALNIKKILFMFPN